MMHGQKNIKLKVLILRVIIISLAFQKVIKCITTHLMGISGFRREVDEIFASLGYYTQYNGNSLPTFRDNMSIQS